MDAENLNPVVWGPQLWHCLMVFALAYPEHPNAVTKRKYYDFIHNLPILLPTSESRKLMTELLDQYPVQPYLRTRESLVLWVHFLHNRLNRRLGKQEIGFNEAMDRFYANYRTPINPGITNSPFPVFSKRAVMNGFIASVFIAIIWYSYRSKKVST